MNHTKNAWVVGAGYWGSKIVDTLDKMGVHADVIDIRGGNTIDDIDNLNPVILATPLWDHYEHAIRVLDHGNDLFVEKPMTETYEQACELGTHIRSTQTFASGLIYRHHPALELITHEAAELGDLIHIEFTRKNWGIYQTKTSPILSLAPHDVSLMRHFLPDSTFLRCDTRNYFIRNVDQPDRVFMGIELSDAEVSIDVSWFHPEKIRKVVLIYDNGTIIWDDMECTVTVHQGSLVGGKLVRDEGNIIYYGLDKTPLELELHDFLNCCVTKETPKASYEVSKDVAWYLDKLLHSSEFT